MHDPYVYPGTTVLKNNFNIKNDAELHQLEGSLAVINIRELRESPIQGIFDCQHYCEIHKRIFGEIYEWAGKLRTIDIVKDEAVLGNLSIDYEEHGKIEKSLDKVLKQLNERPWGTLTLDEKAKFMSSDMAELWKVHGFREGNTRTTVIFCCDFAEKRGMPIKRDIFERNSAYVRNALVAANAKFSDLGDLSQPEYLTKIIKDSMLQGQEEKNIQTVSGLRSARIGLDLDR